MTLQITHFLANNTFLEKKTKIKKSANSSNYQSQAGSVQKVNFIHNRAMKAGKSNLGNAIYIKCQSRFEHHCNVAILYNYKTKKVFYNKHNHLPRETEINEIYKTMKRTTTIKNRISVDDMEK